MKLKALSALQVWKVQVLPILQKHIAEQVDSMTTYMILQHEAAIANLLEVPAKDGNLVSPQLLKQTLHQDHLCAAATNLCLCSAHDG